MACVFLTKIKGLKAKSKKATVCVTNDLVSDQRVHRTCLVLVDQGYSVLLVGRKFRDSARLQRPYKTYRLRLLFNKKVFFYAEYNIRLFFLLLFSRSHLIVSNDLDTLLACFVASRIRKTKLMYDSHEYFTQVPELIHRPKVQKVWEYIERKIFPQLSFAITVSDSIAAIYKEKYGVPVFTIRNLPLSKSWNQEQIVKIKGECILIYQGALNVGRGIELLIDAVALLDERFVLLIAGSGDIEYVLKAQVKRLNIENRIHFLGRIPAEELHLYTQATHLGFSLEEDIGFNYRYALPNKLFDYIQAHVPVICSALPEMEKLVAQYKVGICLPKEQMNASYLADLIRSLWEHPEQLNEWKLNCIQAAKELNWEKEQQKLKRILNEFVD